MRGLNPPRPAAFEARASVLVDINNDGVLDRAAYGRDRSTPGQVLVRYYFDDGTINTGDTRSDDIIDFSRDPQMVAGDFNGDGFGDVALLTGTRELPTGTVHIFDNMVTPPKYVQTIDRLIDDPGWVTFTLKGDFAYPSTGDVIDPRGKKIVARLKDEQGHDVQSEKVIEIDWVGGAPARNGDQFGVGRAP